MDGNIEQEIELPIDDLQELLENRTTNYRLFSRLFLRPLDADEVEGLADMRLEDVAVGLADNELLADGFNDMGRGLHRRHTGTVKLLNTDYTMCFDGVSAMNGQTASPYASLYIGSKKGDKAQLFQEPRTFAKDLYHSEHIEIDKSLNLPDDHLSFEFSFLADLSVKISEALAEEDFDEALRLVEVSQSFCSEHVLVWYEQMYEIAMQLVKTRFYRGLLKATYGYLRFDVEILDTMKEVVEGKIGRDTVIVADQEPRDGDAVGGDGMVEVSTGGVLSENAGNEAR